MALIMPCGAGFAQQPGESPVADSDVQGKPPSLLELPVPEHVAIVKDRFAGNSGRTVIHIQDSHCNYEAQCNIAEILKAYTGRRSQEPVSLIAVEGATGAIDLSPFDMVPDAKIKDIIARYFMQNGSLTGAEYNKLFSAPGTDIQGIEDENVYIHNFKQFNTVYFYRDGALACLQQMQDAIRKVIPSVFDTAQSEFLAKQDLYDSGELPLTDYCPYLQTVAERYAIDWKRYDNFSRMVRLAGIKEPDAALVDSERAQFVNALQKKLSKQGLSEMVRNSLLFRTGKMSALKFYGYLQAAARSAKLDTAPFAGFNEYVAMIEINELLDADALSREISALQSTIRERAFTTADQRDCDGAMQDLKLLGKLVRLELRREEIPRFLEKEKSLDGAALCATLRRLAAVAGVDARLPVDAGQVTAHMAEIDAFYRTALERDEVIVRNTIASMDRDKGSSAVIIAGGFHTPGIVERLRSRGISYLVIAPRMRTVYDSGVYVARMLDQPLPLEMALTAAGSLISPVDRWVAQGYRFDIEIGGEKRSFDYRNKAALKQQIRILNDSLSRFFADKQAESRYDDFVIQITRAIEKGEAGQVVVPLKDDLKLVITFSLDPAKALAQVKALLAEKKVDYGRVAAIATRAHGPGSDKLFDAIRQYVTDQLVAIYEKRDFTGLNDRMDGLGKLFVALNEDRRLVSDRELQKDFVSLRATYDDIAQTTGYTPPAVLARVQLPERKQGPEQERAILDLVAGVKDFIEGRSDAIMDKVREMPYRELSGMIASPNAVGDMSIVTLPTDNLKNILTQNEPDRLQINDAVEELLRQSPNVTADRTGLTNSIYIGIAALIKASNRNEAAAFAKAFMSRKEKQPFLAAAAGYAANARGEVVNKLYTDQFVTGSTERKLIDMVGLVPLEDMRTENGLTYTIVTFTLGDPAAALLKDTGGSYAIQTGGVYYIFVEADMSPAEKGAAIRMELDQITYTGELTELPGIESPKKLELRRGLSNLGDGDMQKGIRRAARTMAWYKRAAERAQKPEEASAWISRLYGDLSEQKRSDVAKRGELIQALFEATDTAKAGSVINFLTAERDFIGRQIRGSARAAALQAPAVGREIVARPDVAELVNKINNTKLAASARDAASRALFTLCVREFDAKSDYTLVQLSRATDLPREGQRAATWVLTKRFLQALATFNDAQPFSTTEPEFDSLLLYLAGNPDIIDAIWISDFISGRDTNTAINLKPPTGELANVLRENAKKVDVWNTYINQLKRILEKIKATGFVANDRARAYDVVVRDGLPGEVSSMLNLSPMRPLAKKGMLRDKLPKVMTILTSIAAVEDVPEDADQAARPAQDRRAEKSRVKQALLSKLLDIATEEYGLFGPRIWDKATGDPLPEIGSYAEEMASLYRSIEQAPSLIDTQVGKTARLKFGVFVATLCEKTGDAAEAKRIMDSITAYPEFDRLVRADKIDIEALAKINPTVVRVMELHKAIVEMFADNGIKLDSSKIKPIEAWEIIKTDTGLQPATIDEEMKLVKTMEPATINEVVQKRQLPVIRSSTIWDWLDSVVAGTSGSPKVAMGMGSGLKKPGKRPVLVDNDAVIRAFDDKLLKLAGELEKKGRLPSTHLVDNVGAKLFVVKKDPKDPLFKLLDDAGYVAYNTISGDGDPYIFIPEDEDPFKIDHEECEAYLKMDGVDPETAHRIVWDAQIAFYGWTDIGQSAFLTGQISRMGPGELTDIIAEDEAARRVHAELREQNRDAIIGLINYLSRKYERPLKDVAQAVKNIGNVEQFENSFRRFARQRRVEIEVSALLAGLYDKHPDLFQKTLHRDLGYTDADGAINQIINRNPLGVYNQLRSVLFARGLLQEDLMLDQLGGAIDAYAANAAPIGAQVEEVRVVGEPFMDMVIAKVAPDALKEFTQLDEDSQTAIASFANQLFLATEKNAQAEAGCGTFTYEKLGLINKPEAVRVMKAVLSGLARLKANIAFVDFALTDDDRKECKVKASPAAIDDWKRWVETQLSKEGDNVQVVSAKEIEKLKDQGLGTKLGTALVDIIVGGFRARKIAVSPEQIQFFMHELEMERYFDRDTLVKLAAVIISHSDGRELRLTNDVKAVLKGISGVETAGDVLVLLPEVRRDKVFFDTLKKAMSTAAYQA